MSVFAKKHMEFRCVFCCIQKDIYALKTDDGISVEITVDGKKYSGKLNKA